MGIEQPIHHSYYIIWKDARTHTTISTKEALLAEKIDKANSFSSFGRQKTQLLEKVD